MAKNSNNEELRQHALSALAQGRAEISAEMHHLRKQISPARMMRRVVDRHPSLVVLLAFTAGIIPALAVFRGKSAPVSSRKPVVVSVSTPPPGTRLRTVLVGAFGVLGKAAIPALVKSAILPRVLDSLSGRSPGATRNAGPAADVK